MSIIFSGVNLLRSTKENAYYSCTIHDVVTVPYAMRLHCLDAILDRPGTFCLDVMCSVFLAREQVSFLWHSLADETLVIFCLLQVYSFAVFILIIGFVDVMITMCSAHCICFYEFKQDQLRSTRFNSITNYWTSFRFYKIFTALYLLLFVTIFEKYTRSWTVKRWPFYRTSSGFVVFWKQCYCESC